MKCFRIYTEDVNRPAILKDAQNRFPCGFTFITGRGCWKGIEEACLIIEIICESTVKPTVHRLASDIKRLNKQDAVLVTETDIAFSEFV